MLITGHDYVDNIERICKLNFQAPLRPDPMARMAREKPTAGAVRYLLDGELRSVEVGDPTRTVLQHLREDLGRTGTKEGCAEGDCGACTVVLAELDGGRLRYRAINSCIQFLPTLDGRALLTVESLKHRESGALHPVQQAMADCHGSQCGFCTPGFVMSLHVLYKTDSAPDRAHINDALAGNLCRCTGYRSIVEAAQAMHALGTAIPAPQQDWISAPAAQARPGSPGRCVRCTAAVAWSLQRKPWAPFIRRARSQRWPSFENVFPTRVSLRAAPMSGCG